MLNYRREIDGLRALAVLPVVFFHAGLAIFSGGFIGVDIFFVISGYLITSIILDEMEQERFSLLKFYERRARRILPALYVIMLASLLVGYFTLMPDEFKNLGQSLVATSLFSNNVLLALTSGYWDLAAEFKPLLHTWSLGVEEQYYIVVPLALLIAWRNFRNRMFLFFSAIFIISFIAANVLVNYSPRWAFYLLPTRAWEIALGGAVAVVMRSGRIESSFNRKAFNALSLLGLVMILVPIFIFDSSTPSPGYQLLLPTLGVCLIILFGREGTLANRILSQRALVFIGLLSYSLYLWHQPVFAYLRAISTDEPGFPGFAVALALVYVLSHASWKYVETPFRSKRLVGQKSIFIFSAAGCMFFVFCGLYLNKNYGIPERVFDATIRIEDMDKRIYNERVFDLKMESFAQEDKKKILILGNSFARDFVNITREIFDTSGVEIVYRDDVAGCITANRTSLARQLFAQADVIVFASGSGYLKCALQDIAFASGNKKEIYFVGTKDFGYNLNWLIRLSESERKSRFNAISDEFIGTDLEMQRAIPDVNYISLLSPTLVGNKVPITDEQGRMLSTDRTHLTKYGAIFFGERAVKNTPYAAHFP